jgi:membrane fusion protein (multidrug efflux system)
MPEQDRERDKETVESASQDENATENEKYENLRPAESDEGREVEIGSKPNGSKRRRFIFIGAVAVLILAVAGLIYWLYARQFESTDDAFIDGDIIEISPKVSAYVTKIYVRSNQYVHKDDLLVDLDPADFRIKLEQAKAQLQNAKSQYSQAVANVNLTKRTTSASQAQALSNVETSTGNIEQTRLGAMSKRSQITQAQAAVRTAQANLAQASAQIGQGESNVHLAQVEYDRRLALFSHGDISRQSVDQALNALQTSQSQLNALQKQVDAARARVDEATGNLGTANENYRQSLAQVGVTRSQAGESQGRLQEANAAPERVEVSQSQVETAQAGVTAAEEAVHEAELELSYTKICAPEEGYVTRKTVEEGQLVAVGTPMMAISQSDEIWVIANFKETQLADMKVGEPVDIKIDAYPKRSFHGKVESLQAGTGSRFSLLPAENATGNFVKVVQRVPVKIVFDEQPGDVLLAPGMSAEPSVKVR